MTVQLFTPVELGGITLPNRIVVSPMCQYSAVDGSAQPWHQVHYGMLAMSGAGLLCLEATHVEREGRITLARFRDLVGTSRRVAQLLLEQFDNDGITRRIGDERVLRRTARS